jgi:uncharacterized membrane protein HdeD (DUF308 family)
MRLAIARNWWAMVIRGVLGIAIGIATFIWPAITFAALVFLFAGYAFVDGVVSLAGAFRAVEAHERWGALLFEGIVGLGAGVVTVLWPGITAIGLVFVIAAWAVVTGVAEIMLAVRLRRHVSGEWLLALAGSASVIFGVMILTLPAMGALVLAIWFGIYAVFFGLTLVALGFRLRRWHGASHSGHVMPAPVH